MFIIDIMMAISNWLWGWPLLILTSAVAVYLSIHYSVYDRKCFHYPSHSPDVLSRITELTASFRLTTADRST